MASSSLTCADSFFVPRLVRAVVAVQALVVVAGFGLVARLAKLLCTGSAAVAAINEQADAWGAPRGCLGALAGPLAVLGAVVRLRHGQERRRGCYGDRVPARSL